MYFAASSSVAASSRATKTKESKPVASRATKAKESKPVATASGQASKFKGLDPVVSTASGQMPKVTKTSFKKGGDASETLRIDGRCERIQKSLKQYTQVVAGVSAEIKLDETVQGWVLTGDALKESQAALARKSQAVRCKRRSSANLWRRSIAARMQKIMCA